MKAITQINSLKIFLNQARRKNQTIGFVPTMGAFHGGHLKLMNVSRRENDISVVSIFVNPTQFGPAEDFSSYPRDKKRDCSLAKKENVDIIFYPSVEEMYPRRYGTYVDVERVTATLCGVSRPGHFRGVATVVAKLLNIVEPDTIYLGQKDAQQCVVIKEMVRDLNFPVKVRVIPTVREADGLAMSSRNQYLLERERKEAPVLYQALLEAKQVAMEGERRVQRIIELVRKRIENLACAQIDYIACVDAETLQPLEKLEGKVLLALAVKFGRARLIDNIIFHVRN
ncbi:MAG: pantoate--beta-alanine ligase [Candidatus Omnitrophica bacterium]|nr:pantoate--beta-alanine ligase [Candidatus Omnitrophota bacterium]